MLTDYLDGFQYTNQVLKFFPHAEGYVSAVKEEESYRFFYVYNYTDHLGNIRVSYGKDPDTQELKILEENHYYPFGLKHTNYNSGKNKFDLKELAEQQQQNQQQALEYRIKQLQAGEFVPYNYKYNGKEWQDELGLNMYDYGGRIYAPDAPRFWQIDPKAEKYYNISPYVYVADNPILHIDPDGKEIIVANKKTREPF